MVCSVLPIPFISLWLQKSRLYNRNASAFIRRRKPSTIHAHAGSPFPVACAEWLLTDWWLFGEVASQASPVRKVGTFFQGVGVFGYVL